MMIDSFKLLFRTRGGGVGTRYQLLVQVVGQHLRTAHLGRAVEQPAYQHRRVWDSAVLVEVRLSMVQALQRESCPLVVDRHRNAGIEAPAVLFREQVNDLLLELRFELFELRGRSMRSFLISPRQ